MPTPSFILPTSVPVVDASVEALRVYDGSPAGFDVLPMSFTRASTATRTDSAGNIVEAVPYNLVQYSEQFDNAAWTKSSTTISANVTTAPNGNATADLIYPTSSGNYRLIRQSTFSPWSGTYTASIYAKAAGINNLTLLDYDGAGAGINFNLSTGVATNYSTNPFISYSMTAVGDGWYRCTATALNGYYYWFLSDGGSAVSVTANGTDGVYIWGAQLVLGTQPLPYQETVTRLALPRLDYINADGTLSSTPRLLLEPQRTNSIRNSTMVGAVAGSPGTLPTNWAINNLFGLTQTIGTIGTESGLSYIDFRFNGTANASGNLEIRSEAPTQIAALNSQVWTNSTYVKLVANPSPANSVGLGIYERNSVGTALAFGQETITPTTSLARFTFTRTLVGGATVAFVQPLINFNLTSGQAYDFTIRIAAPQMELGSYATTFIPTTTAAVTRLADACSLTGASSIIGQTEGTLFAEINVSKLLGSVSRYIFHISDGTTNNRIYFAFSGSGTDVLRGRIFSGGVLQCSINTATITATGTYKLALAYKLNDIAFYVNGVQVGTDTSATIPTCSRIDVGSNYASASQFSDGIAQAGLYTTRLSNSELQSLTTL